MGAVRDNVTISYRGEHYEIGRAAAAYGIWAEGEPLPIEAWPDTPEGWYAAWARFVTLEVPGAIRPVAGPATLVAQAPELVGPPVPAGDTSTSRLDDDSQLDAQVPTDARPAGPRQGP